MTAQQKTPRPDGIEGHHLEAGKRPWLRPWIAPAVLGALLLGALLGLFGGAPYPTLRDEQQRAALAMTAPRVLRNGEFFEIKLRVEARGAIAKPRIAVTPAYWRHLTINTMIPAPSEEGYEDGRFTFAFEPLEAGQSLELKIDGQINPARFGNSSGAVTLLDDKSVLAELPVHLRVLP